MPTPKHYRITFSGTFGAIGAPVEIWSWGLGLVYGGADIPVALAQTRAAAFQAAYAANIAPQMSGSVVLTRTRYSQHDEGGHVATTSDGAYRQGDDVTVVPGGSLSTLKYPLQTSLVVSLSTARAGATGKGRCFLPMVPKPLGTDFLLPQSDASAMADAFAGFLQAIYPEQGTPGVISSHGYGSTLTGIRVGRVPDTMRSRRNALLESYEVRSPVLS